MPAVKEIIEKFRQGDRFQGPVDEYIIKGRPDAGVMRDLTEFLKKEDDPVREQIFRLMAEIGKNSDPLFAKGGNLVRDRQIITLLIQEGLARPGLARDFCQETLVRSVPAPFLKDHGKAIAENLRKSPDGLSFISAAKAKYPDSRPVIDSLFEKTTWGEKPEAALARAALGDSEIEGRFINDFIKNKEPEQKAELAKYLGYIGTDKALAALAGEMRSDMVIEMPGVMRTSIRVPIVAALSYNFPEKTFLYDNAVQEDKDYEIIEKFCTETFGTTWRTERPPFLWIQGFPSDVPE